MGIRKTEALALTITLVTLVPLLIAGSSTATPDSNNDFASAVEAQKGDWVSESVSATDDMDDFYTMYLDVGEEIVANLLVPPAVNFDLYLYDPGQNMIDLSERDNVIEDNPYERVSAIADSVGWYYVGVHAYAGSGNYALMIAEMAEWTYMVYLDGDNDLETEGITDFLEMAVAGSTPDVNIVVEFDRWNDGDTGYGNWTDCNRFLVGQGMEPTTANSLMDLGEVNMGSADTLIDFVNWSVNMFPAQKYALDLWDHGGSWYGVCWDYSSLYDYIDMGELWTALDTTHSQNDGLLLDLVGYDACNMASVEVGFEVQNYALVSVGSELVEPNPGWNYELDMLALTQYPNMSAEDFGAIVVTDYVDSYRIPIPPYTHEDVTLSALRSSRIAEINFAIENFSVAMLDSWSLYCEYFRHARNTPAETYDTEFVDLYHLAQLTVGSVPNITIRALAQQIMDLVNASVIAEDHYNLTGSQSTLNAHGITIYFPQDGVWYNPDYESTPYALSTSWDELLKTYFSTSQNAPRIDSYSPSSNPTIDEGQEQAFSIGASDSDGNYLTYSWYLDLELVADETNNSYIYRTDSNSAGAHTVRARVSDGTMTASHMWTVTVRESDLNPPSSRAEGPVAYWQTAPPTTITCAASDVEGSVANATLWHRFSRDNSSWSDWALFGIDEVQPWSWDFTFPNGDGYYEFYTTATDDRGNEEAAPVSADLIYGLDSVAPEITVTGELAVGTGDIYSISATISDTIGVVEAYAVFWFGSESETNSTMALQGGSSYALDVPIPLDSLATLHYEILASDVGGGWSSSATVDVTVVDDDPPTADAGDSIDTISGIGTAFDGSSSTDNIGILNYTWTFEYNGTVHELYGPSPTFTFWTGGVYEVILNVSDEEGNYAESVVTVTVSAQVIPEFGNLLIPAVSTAILLVTALAWLQRRERKERKG